MLVPAKILKMHKLLGNDVWSANGIGIQRKGDKLEATMNVKGHYSVTVSWNELSMQDYPLIPGQTISLEKSDELFFLSAEVCEKALKVIPKKGNFPILQCLLVEEVINDNKVRCFTTDLDNHMAFTSEQEPFDHITKWVKDTTEEFQNVCPKVWFNPHYLSDICLLITDLLGISRKVHWHTSFEGNMDAHHAFRISSSNDEFEVTAYLMPMYPKD